MTKDNPGYFDPRYPFSRLSLQDHEVWRFLGARHRDRGLPELAFEAAVLRSCLGSNENAFEDNLRTGMKHAIDALRLAIAAIPAQDEASLAAKIGALDPPGPAIAANANFEAMIETGLQRDLARFRPIAGPEWIPRPLRK